MNAIAQPKDYYSDEFTTLGERISVARERLNLSTEELARSLAVGEQTLSDWEGDSSEPRSNKLAMLAGMLGVSPSWLLYGVGEGVPSPEDAASIEEDALRERLLSELREAQTLNAQVQNRIARITDALAALR